LSFTFKTIMENKQALLLLEKNLKDLNKKKFSVESIVTDLKKIREITLDLQNPVVTKSLRLAYEHLEIKNAFLIAIPADEPIDNDEIVNEVTFSDANNIESLTYYLSLFTDLNKKNNLLDIKEYNKAFLSI
jgi:type IV secretory pathway ATPase VirB11/archaellum biosynthesis ATPase